MKRVLFIYAGERKKLNELIQDGKAPDTQLYGMNHMSDFEVSYKEFGDTPFRKFIGSILGFRLRHMFMYFRTNGYDFVYGSSLIYTAFLKRLFGSGARFVLINISLNRILNSHAPTSMTYKFLQWCLGGVEIITCFSHTQVNELQKKHGIPAYKLEYIPFGVDVSFYTPVSSRKEYVLSVGRDNGRDYKTVVDVARAMPEREFKLILSARNLKGVETIPSNVKVMFDAPPEEVRKAYSEATALLLITHADQYGDGADCSGQTVLLDAFAARLPVIVTEKAYLKDYAVANEEILVVPPYDIQAIISALQKIPQVGKVMAEKARARTEKEFSTTTLANYFAAIAKQPWITYVANARIPTQKAHGVQIMHTCEALTKNGARVELIVPHRRTDVQVNPYEYYSVAETFPIKTFFTIDLIWFGPFGFIMHEWLFMRGVRNYLRRFPLGQIVYVRGERVFLELTPLTTHHRIFYETHIKPRNFEKKCSEYVKAAGVVVVTKYYQHEMEQAGFKDRVLWAPDGVDMTLFSMVDDTQKARVVFALPTDKKIVGYVGKLTTMDQEKGIGTLLEAFLGVWKTHPEAFLLIVGATEGEQKSVTQQLTKLKVPERAYQIVGHVPHATALHYMQVADMLVMNYPNSSHYAHYMSPLKLFEYMASGVPIVSTDLPSIRDVLSEKNAIMIPPENTMALGEALSDIIEHPATASALAQQALTDVKAYTWEARAHAVLSFIQQHA